MKTMRSITVAALLLGLWTAVAGASTYDPMVVSWLQGGELQDGDGWSDNPDRDIRVQVWHGKDDDAVYERSEELEVYFRTNADMYVVVYRIATEGEVEILWPTSRFDDGFVYGNHTYTVPKPGHSRRLRVGDDRGVEYVEAIASAYPFDLRDVGIDFRFDLDERERYDYSIDGDPFLAVNDINYAITGLDEDVDYVVTDWAHVYVRERVTHARYTCNQCHLGDDGHPTVRPYVDTCVKVNVHTDWGWHRGWYVSYGWYPLYYEPAYYYWDPFYSRPYWFAYYPVHYRWPGRHCYTRPYYVHWWHESPYYGGDYRDRWESRRTRNVPLYDAARGRLLEKSGERTRYVPASVRGVDRDTKPGRLVQDTMPSRTRRDMKPAAGAGRNVDRSGVRPDRGSPGTRRITSRAPVGREGRGEGRDIVPPTRRSDRDGSIDEKQQSGRTERRWTRPRIRNGDPAPRSDRERSKNIDRQRERDRRSGGGADVRRESPRQKREERSQARPTPRKRDEPREKSSAKPAPNRRDDRGSKSSVRPAPKPREKNSSSNRGGGSPSRQKPPSSRGGRGGRGG